MSNREIGERLLISEATVKFHVRNLRDAGACGGAPRSCTPRPVRASSDDLRRTSLPWIADQADG
jgi:hypothetical protein